MGQTFFGKVIVARSLAPIVDYREGLTAIGEGLLQRYLSILSSLFSTLASLLSALLLLSVVLASLLSVVALQLSGVSSMPINPLLPKGTL